MPVSTVPPTYIPWTLHRNSFTELSGGRAPGQVNSGHHYQHGVPGDWRSHFGPEHVTAFRQRFGDMAGQLGYRRKALCRSGTMRAR